VGLVLVLSAVGCTPSDQPAGDDTASDNSEITSDNGEINGVDPNDLDALIAAAQEEGELTVYWHSSRIAAVAENFEKLYGIKVNGSKLNDFEQTERVIREVNAGNVQVDVIGYDDGARLETELIPEGYVENWVPPQFAGLLPEDSTNPLVYLWQPMVWGYNTQTYDSCPVTNVWQLTDDERANNVAILDPQLRSVMLQWFTAIISDPEMMEAAYEEQYGEVLETDAKNAGWEFVARLAANNPLLFQEDVELAASVGAAGQSNPPIGMYYLGRHRELAEKGLSLGVCSEMKPFYGFDAPTFVQTVVGGPNPNAARLFVHYLFTEEGVAPWVADNVGGYSPHPEIKANPTNPFSVRSEWEGNLLVANNLEISKNRQQLLDFWLVNK